MLLRSKPNDHIFITALDNNLSSQQQITPYSADFPSLSSTNSDFELTLTLIIIMDLLSVPKTRTDSDLFWIVKCKISVVYIVYTVHVKRAKSTAPINSRLNVVVRSPTLFGLG